MYEIKIEGMTCDGCVNSVKNSVLSTDPSAIVQVDLHLGIVKVESKLPERGFKVAIEDAGFDVIS